MGSQTLTAVTCLISGAAVTNKGGVTSGQTVTIGPTTAQGSLDFESLHIRIYHASTSTVTISLGVGTQFSDKGIGAYTITIASTKTVIVGGHDFEGARFLTSAGTIVFTQLTGNATTWEAYQSPRATE